MQSKEENYFIREGNSFPYLQIIKKNTIKKIYHLRKIPFCKRKKKKKNELAVMFKKKLIETI